MVPCFSCLPGDMFSNDINVKGDRANHPVWFRSDFIRIRYEFVMIRDNLLDEGNVICKFL